MRDQTHDSGQINTTTLPRCAVEGLGREAICVCYVCRLASFLGLKIRTIELGWGKDCRRLGLGVRERYFLKFNE